MGGDQSSKDESGGDQGDQKFGRGSCDTPIRTEDRRFADVGIADTDVGSPECRFSRHAYFLRTPARCPHYRQRAFVVQVLVFSLLQYNQDKQHMHPNGNSRCMRQHIAT